MADFDLSGDDNPDSFARYPSVSCALLIGIHVILLSIDARAAAEAQKWATLLREQPKTGRCRRPGRLYLICIPRGNETRAITLTHLQAETYRGYWYDPRTAKAKPVDNPAVDAYQWKIPQRPSSADEDWIVCLEKRR